VWGDAGPLEPAVAAAGRLEPHSGPEPPAEAAANPAPVVEGGPYRPDLPPPEDFVAVIDNPYMPSSSSPIARR
jgi:hypothetical protein